MDDSLDYQTLNEYKKVTGSNCNLVTFLIWLSLGYEEITNN